MSAVGGYIAAALSAAFNGSFCALFKFEAVASVQLDPFWFQLYVSLGVFLSCFVFCVFLPLNPHIQDGYTANFEFAPLAMAAGALFNLSVVCSFAAIPLLGLATAQGVWGGLSIIISFVWGVALFGNHVKSGGLAALSLILLVTGVIGIAACEEIANAITGHASLGPETSRISVQKMSKTELGTAEPDHDGNVYALMDEGNSRTSTSRKRSISEVVIGTRMRAIGFAAALGTGVFGGSTLAPAHYVATADNGLSVLPAFGVGTLITTTIVTAVWVATRKAGELPLPPMHLGTTFVPGLISGTLWNISNVLAIYAIPQIGFAVAYPMLQCALFVAGLWGIFVFKEIQGTSVSVFFVSGAVLIVGAIVLALNTTQ